MDEIVWTPREFKLRQRQLTMIRDAFDSGIISEITLNSFGIPSRDALSVMHERMESIAAWAPNSNVYRIVHTEGSDWQKAR